MNNHLYHWKGINRSGKSVSGSLITSCMAMVKMELHHQGITRVRISKNRTIFQQKIKQSSLTLFFRQLATMLKVGIPLIQSLEIISNNQANISLKNLIQHIKNDIEKGFSLSEVFHKHTRYFNDLIRNLITIGEKSGKLDLILDKIANYKEKNELLKKRLRKILVYPSLVLILTCLITTALLLFVVPQFASLFASFGAELPLLTRLIIRLSHFIANYWLFFLSVFLASIYGILFCKNRLTRLALALDDILLKLPVLGTVFQKSILARFSRTLAITFSAGLPLVEALKLVETVTGNLVYAQATTQIREELSKGQQMQIALKNTCLFPDMVIQLVAIGEESGELEFMLTKIADFYEEEVNCVTDTLTNLLEPIIITFLGVMIGSVVLAMYLPIFKLGSTV